MLFRRYEIKPFEGRAGGGEAVERKPRTHFALALCTDAFLLLFLVACSVKDMATRKGHGARGLVTQRLEANSTLHRFVDFTERSRHVLVGSLNAIAFFLQFRHRFVGVEIIFYDLGVVCLQFMTLPSKLYIVTLESYVIVEEGRVHGFAGVGSQFPGVALILDNGPVIPTRLVLFFVRSNEELGAHDLLYII